MMLATIGFQYVIQENVPKTPTITYLDSYVIVCLLLILFVVLGAPRLHPHPLCQPGTGIVSQRAGACGISRPEQLSAMHSKCANLSKMRLLTAELSASAFAYGISKA